MNERNIFAHTEAKINLPGFLTVNSTEDGRIKFYVRSADNVNISTYSIDRDILQVLVNALILEIDTKSES